MKVNRIAVRGVIDEEDASDEMVLSVGRMVAKRDRFLPRLLNSFSFVTFIVQV